MPLTRAQQRRILPLIVRGLAAGGGVIEAAEEEETTMPMTSNLSQDDIQSGDDIEIQKALNNDLKDNGSIGGA